MEPLITMLESIRGAEVHTTPLREVLKDARGPGAVLLRSLVRKQEQPLASALRTDPALLAFARRASPEQRRQVMQALVRWATHGAKPTSKSNKTEAKATRKPEPASVLHYALEQRIEERLEDPMQVLRHLATYEEWHRLRRLAPTEGRLRDLVAFPAFVPVVRTYLEYCVRRRETIEARARRWSEVPATPALRALAERLHRRYRELGTAEPPPPTRTIDIDSSVDADRLALVLLDRGAYPPSSIGISLIRGDARGAVVQTSLFPEHPLVRVALERALDIVHDPTEPLHRPLRTAVEMPRWERLVSSLRDAVAPARSAPLQLHRLVWRLHGADPLAIEAAVQKRTERGFTSGKLVALDSIRRAGVVLDEHDERVLSAAAPPPFANPFASRSPDRRGAMLEALAGHPRVLVRGAPGRVVLRSPELVVLEEEGELALLLRMGDALLLADEASGAVVSGTHFVRLDEELGEVEVARLEPALVALLEAVGRYATRVPLSAADSLVAALARLPASVGLELPASIAGEARAPEARPVVQAEPLPGGGLRAQVFVRPLSGGPLHRPGEGPTHLVAVVDGARTHTQRDLAAERHAFDALLAAGLEAGLSEGRHSVRFDATDDALFFLELLSERPELASLEWPEDAPRWRVTRATRFDLGLRRAEHWFEADARIDVDDAQVTLAALLLALRQGRRYVAVGKGRFAHIAGELRAQLEAIEPVVQVRGDTARIAPSAAAYVGGAMGSERVSGDRAWKALNERLHASATARPGVPEALDATLRDYQVEGVEWLLRTAGWAEGACLADEMGLGKTVQALALLLARAAAGPALVVCPTSVGDNWAAECQRFAHRGLRPILHRGAERGRRLEKLGPGDLLIASYDVVVRDREALSAIGLSTLVLDEAQAIKNPSAQRTIAIGELRAGFRLALTGTPIENRLSELFSLYSVLAPGLLGSWQDFRARFAVPIEKHGDAQRLARLRELVRPFLLRRTKAMVARELPPRTEIIRPVELGEEERALYEAQRQHAVRMLEEKRGDPTFRFALLAELTRLRRLVCHPALVAPESTAPSSKLEELFALVEDLRREEHRALVFSQFTSLLAFVRKELDARRIDYLYLDGGTPAAERGKLVQRWQEGDAPLFLISLKAGGTGLNLTAADYVVHLDPWWNPAVEDQASDRAHRIGQTKPVTVVRLVVQGTIEERVLALHGDKRRLAAGILEGAETSATLEPDELLALLSDGEPASSDGKARKRPTRPARP